MEVRRAWHSSDVAWFADRAEWRDRAGFVMVETVRTVNGVEGKPERRCFITSLKADARAFRKLVRRHWGVESMHWTLDVTYGEDYCRARTRHAAANRASIRRRALSLTVPWARRRKCGIRDARMYAALSKEARLEMLTA